MSDPVERRLHRLISASRPGDTLGGGHILAMGNAADEIDRLRAQIAELTRERDEARATADRSLRRLVELTEPGAIGAFAARDQAVARAEAAEAKLAVARADALEEAAVRLACAVATRARGGRR